MSGQAEGELFGQEGGVGLGEFIGVAGEAGAGERFAGGVLEAGEPEAGPLGPVVGDVLQTLGVGGERAEELPGAFEAAELLFGGGGARPRKRARRADALRRIFARFARRHEHRDIHF